MLIQAADGGRKYSENATYTGVEEVYSNIKSSFNDEF